MSKKRNSRKITEKVAKGQSSSTILPLNFITGSKLFTFYNGDTYEGEYLADSLTYKIFRHGKGIYKSHKGISYNGTWKNDKLIENVQITFSDESFFEGEVNLKLDFVKGIFKFPDKSCLMGNFTNAFNETGRINNLEFKDPNGKIWIPFYENGRIKLKYFWDLSENEEPKKDINENCAVKNEKK